MVARQSNPKMMANVQPHVAVQDMAEFVADDALQFIAGEHVNGATGDADGGIAGRVAGGEGIDGALVVQHIHLRHGHAGSDGHFFDDIEQLAFVGVRGVLGD
jgi:hypothetical protein